MEKKAKYQARAKKPKAKSQERVGKPKEQAANLLARVPGEYAFLCHDGKILTDMKELAEGLAAMSDEAFMSHSNPEKNDFSNWVRDVIKDEKLATDLATATTRLEAVGIVTSRLAFLRGGLFK